MLGVGAAGTVLGTSFAASIIPSPSSILPEKVKSPRNSRVVWRNAVRQMAMTC